MHTSRNVGRPPPALSLWIPASATLVLLMSLAAAPHGSYAASYYVATNGNDADEGTIERPFRTLLRARYAAVPGDTIYLRNGTYDIENYMDISGTATAPVTVLSYPGEWAVFDGNGDTGVKFRVSGSWLVFEDFEVRNGPSDGVLITDGAGHITMRRVVSHDNCLAGFEIENGAHDVLLENCDAYSNFDANTYGEHADGFGVKYSVGSGNRLVGCRAWDNADDGFDLWAASNTVVLSNCWAYGNGFDRWNVGTNFAGDGNGFKLGPGSPRVVQCMAWNNASRGYDYNDATNIETVENCTSYNNPIGFNFHNAAHVLRNNLSIGDGSQSLSSNADDLFNSWNDPPGISLTSNDFLSLDDTIARGQRASDGTLPKSNFLHPSVGAAMIDAGTLLNDITSDPQGIPRPTDGNFDGTAEFDLGCYEYDPSQTDSDLDGMHNAWEHRYALDPSDPDDAECDNDGDGFVNSREFIADTDPTSLGSYFRITSASYSNPCSIIVFACTNTRAYGLEYAEDLGGGAWGKVEGQTKRLGRDESLRYKHLQRYAVLPCSGLGTVIAERQGARRIEGCSSHYCAFVIVTGAQESRTPPVS